MLKLNNDLIIATTLLVGRNIMKRQNTAFSPLSNLKYILAEFYRYKRLGLTLAFLSFPIRVMLAVITVYVPKVVLDTIESRVSPEEFVTKILIITLLTAAAAIINHILSSTLSHFCNGFNLTYLARRWTETAIDSDYESFTSPAGKTKAEKAYHSLGGSYRWGIGSYLPRFISLLENILGFIAFSAIIVVLNPIIIIFLLAAYAISAAYALHIERWKQSSKDERAAIDLKLIYIAYRTRGLNIGKDIRLYSMAGWLKEMAKRITGEKRSWEERIADREFKRLLLDGLIVFLRDGAAYVYLIYLYINNGLSIGNFVLYFAAVTGFGGWLSKLIDSLKSLSEANNYVTDFREFIELPEKTAGPESLSPLDLNIPPAIELKNVSFSYEEDGQRVLNNISLKIAAGEKLAVVGTNGAGKTTLVKLICGLLTPTEGSVFINGRAASCVDREEYYTLFSAVFQDSGVLPVSIADNIALNVGAVDYERISDCIEQAGLTDKIKSLPRDLETNLVKYISEDGTELSGGELQRLLLARALYKKAPVMILDEPTAALDPIAENEIYLKYNDLTKDKTSIYISHRLSSTRFCDRIILLDESQIAEQGTHEELMSKGGKYAEMFKIQSRYYRESEVC